MTPTDYVLIGIVAISAIVGLFRGLVREVIAVVTWVAALWLAWHYGPELEPQLGGLLEHFDIEAALQQRDGRRQAADAAAGDEHFALSHGQRAWR